MQRRVKTGCRGPPGEFCVGVEAKDEEGVVQQDCSSVNYTGPPESNQAKAADLTCHVLNLHQPL